MKSMEISVVALLLGAALGWIICRLKNRADAQHAGHVLDVARKDAEALVREAKIATQAESQKARETFEAETKQRRLELAEIEKRVTTREVNLDRRMDLLEHKTADLEKKGLHAAQREMELQRLEGELAEQKQRVQQELQRVAGLSADEAKRTILAQLEIEMHAEAAALSRRILEDAKQNAEREARRVITIAIERCASEHVQTVTSCTVTLPSEDMKGRIIGREGRNIRAFEAATGINVLIDDTPQAVVLSGFDPVRRELARQTIMRLVADGRINPSRIEEEVAKVKEELDQTIRKAGEEAAFELGLQNVHPEVLRLLGRLKFRHSFAQNVLDHSIEVARIEGMMAAELGQNAHIGRRVGLFHDIGKAVDHEVEGSHAIIGAELLKKYGESEEVWRGVACHHHETEPLTIYGMLASAADAISASRPGARSESMELYLQRLEKLEEIANSFLGVEKSYALQAGREIRVLVEPQQISDDAALQLARQITKKIEGELQYPGQIKVTVVRETRAVEFAK